MPIAKQLRRGIGPLVFPRYSGLLRMPVVKIPDVTNPHHTAVSVTLTEKEYDRYHFSTSQTTRGIYIVMPYNAW